MIRRNFTGTPVRPCPFKWLDEIFTTLGVVRLKPVKTLLYALLVASACAVPAQSQSATPSSANAPLDVEQLFATTCGWCHSDGGRAAGKGPQLMNSPRDDDFIRNRIKNGKVGSMPAFGSAFSDAQIDQMIKYIRELKPHEG